MVLVNVIAFVALKILHNLVSMQFGCFYITPQVSKITKSVQCDLIFIFNKLPDTSDSFVKTHLVLNIKHVNSFMKTCFY